MHIHRLPVPGVRRALVTAIAGALAAGALAGPAMAATGDGSGSGDITCRKAGEKPMGYIIAVRKAGEKPIEHLTDQPSGSIIAI
jgi:hypothetical protein